jgi:predicted HTH transcriptional regulator
MTEPISDKDVEEKIIKYLSGVKMAKNRDVARATGIEKALVDKLISKLAKEDKLEYLYLGTSYVKLKDK